MKKFLSVLLALIMLFPLAACKGGKETGGNKPILKVGMECNYAPFNWTQIDDSNGAVKIDGTNAYAAGYDVEIAKKIADELGMELVVVKMAWEGLVPAVNSGVIDMIIAGMSPTAERKKAIDFSDIYYISDICIVVKKDGKFANAQSINDFAGAKIISQKNNVHDPLIDTMPGVIHATPLNDTPTMLTALGAGTVDGFIVERPSAIAAVAVNPSFKVISFEEGKGSNTPPEDISIAVGMKKGNDKLSKVNEILAGISQQERDALMSDAIKNQPLE